MGRRSVLPSPPIANRSNLLILSCHSHTGNLILWPAGYVMNTATRMKMVNATTAVVSSQVMQRLMTMAERVAAHDAAVLIVGETGSAKELVARAVHEHSPRRGQV